MLTVLLFVNQSRFYSVTSIIFCRCIVDDGSLGTRDTMQYVNQLQVLVPRSSSKQSQPLAPATIPKKLKLIVLGAAGAGKTSLLRRYFYKQFEYERMPTLGSDFYVGRVPISTPTKSDNHTSINCNMSDGVEKQSHASSESNASRGSSIETTTAATAATKTTTTTTTSAYINLQMWDTPGKENFALRHRRQQQVKYSASLSDSFFQHADAVMLVYDMTSSTSFTRLLTWYGDLM
jgi:GTPase SAR1 family protein